VAGYLDAFAPDTLIECGVQSPPYVASRGLKVARSSEIWERYRTDKSGGIPQYGIGVFEMLNRVFQELGIRQGQASDKPRRWPSLSCEMSSGQSSRSNAIVYFAGQVRIHRSRNQARAVRASARGHAPGDSR
jgi:hypothetical protein